MSMVPFSQVRTSYRMQGTDENYRCNHSNWVPLNGPGYDGGYNGYQSACPNGKTCIQGRCTYLRDAPISASYSNDNINSETTYLTWSGSGVGTQTSTGCARDNQIPFNRPVTWFTRLLIR